MTKVTLSCNINIATPHNLPVDRNASNLLLLSRYTSSLRKIKLQQFPSQIFRDFNNACPFYVKKKYLLKNLREFSFYCVQKLVLSIFKSKLLPCHSYSWPQCVTADSVQTLSTEQWVQTSFT